MIEGTHSAVVRALENCGALADGQIDLAGTALSLAFLNHPGISLSRYENHLGHMADYVRLRHEELLKSGAADNSESRLSALRHVIAGRYGYNGDSESDDVLQNADLIRVIDRRKGGAIALAILYLHSGRAQGWDVYGLNFPGHFLVRLDYGGRRLIFDPFSGGAELQAPELREIVKQALGAEAELAAGYYEPVSNREILVRLQNQIKLRQIEDEDYEAALETVEIMRLIAPDEYRLLFDAGVLYSRTGHPQKAIAALDDYIRAVPHDRDRRDAVRLLREIRETMMGVKEL